LKKSQIPKVWLLLTVCTISVSVLGADCIASTPKNVIVMAKALDDLITLDPAEAFEFSSTEILANVYDRLFIANPKNPSEPKKGLVEDWSRSDDGLEYKFSIRGGAVFDGGRAVTSRDVVFSLQRAVFLNKTPAFILNQLGLHRGNVEERIRVLDERSLLLGVDRPYSSSVVLNILSAMVTSVVDGSSLSEHAKDGDWGANWLRSNTAGSGKFRLSRWSVGEYLVLDRKDATDSRIARIIIRDVREPATQRLMLGRGDIDIARNLTPDHIVALAKKTDAVTWSTDQARIFYLALNQRNPVLADPSIRRALRLAIDYRGITSYLLPGRARVHQAFLPLGFMGSLKETPFSLDLAGARDLINQADFGEDLTFTVDVRSDPIALQIAQALQMTLGQIGIKLDIHPSDGKQVLTKYRARRHDIYMGYWGPDYLDPHSNAAAFASNPDNMDNAEQKTLAWRNYWEIPGLTKDTDHALLIRDQTMREEAYRKIQRQVQEDSPFIILFQEKALTATTNEVKGFKLGLTSDQTLYADIVK